MKLNTKIAISLGAIILLSVVMIAIQAVYNPPVPQNILPGKVSKLNETFYRSDFAYGPQAWKPYGTKTLPIVPDHDPDGSDDFYLMFVDLYATPFGIDELSNYTGGVKVEYNFTDLSGLAAFHVYGFATHSNNLGNIPGIYMTNRVSDPASDSDSGYYVYGASSLTGAVPSTQSLELNLIKVKVANDDGPKYDIYDNGTYSITFIRPDGGLNPLHITTDAASNKRADFGQVTYTNDRSGVFYISDTGGAGISDVIMMVAVNGTMPDTFSLNLKASMTSGSG